MRKTNLTVDVYMFDDFREFLTAAYEDLKRRDSAISYRAIQRLAGYGSTSNHFWQRVTGRAPMSAEAAARYAKALGLNARQTTYFMLLAAKNQAKGSSERAAYEAQIAQMPEYRKARRIGDGKDIRWEYYSKWYLPALRELVMLDDFKEDNGWIAKKISPPITPREVKDGLAKLIKWGYLVRDESGRLRQAEPFIGSINDRKEDDEEKRRLVRSYHKTMINLAAAALDAQPQDKRLIVGGTLHISKKQSASIRERIIACMQEINEIAKENEPAEIVYRINMQMFYMSNWSESENKRNNPKGDVNEN